MDFFILDLLNLCYTNLFLPKDYEMNHKTILKYFQEVLKKLKWKKSIVWFVVIITNLESLKYHTFSKNIEEIKQNDFISKEHKKVCKILNYI